MFDFFRFMIRFRRNHAIIRKKLPDAVCGMDPIHAHDVMGNTQSIPGDARTFSVSFAGYDKEKGKDDLVYISVNSHWEDVRILLPHLENRAAWYLSVNTYGDGEGRYYYEEGMEVRIEGEFIMRPRSVAVFTGRSSQL